MKSPFYSFQAESLQGKPVSFDEYEGKVVLAVNTAGKCGLTPQYEGLEKLHKKYREQGLVILGFPYNQEPGNENSIQEGCLINYGVSFPVSRKMDVNGNGAHPLFAYLTKSLPGIYGGKIKWNFTKFLLDGRSNPVKRFAPTTKPEKLKPAIRMLLENS